jgi:galactose-1-phosphate uridylyltransferase
MSESKATLRTELNQLRTDHYKDSYTISLLLGYILDVGEYIRDHISEEIARELPELPEIDNKYWLFIR